MQLIGHFKDDQYEYKGVSEKRRIVRAVVLDEQNRVALTKIFDTDKFGFRDYYELPGGGIKEHETNVAALKREMEEEIGAKISGITTIGKVIDYYNLIKRENHCYFYLAHVVERVPQRLEPDEITRIEKIVWVKIDEAIRLYENMQNILVGRLVKQRELPILLIAREMINSL